MVQRVVPCISLLGIFDGKWCSRWRLQLWGEHLHALGPSLCFMPDIRHTCNVRILGISTVHKKTLDEITNLLVPSKHHNKPI